MTDNAKNQIASWRAWMNSGLIALSFFLLRGKLTDIEAKMDKVDELSEKMAGVQTKQVIIESNLNLLTAQYHSHVEIMGTKEEQKNLRDLLKPPGEN